MSGACEMISLGFLAWPQLPALLSLEQASSHAMRNRWSPLVIFSKMCHFFSKACSFR